MAQALRWLAGFVWNNPRLSLGIAVGLWLAFAVRRWRRGKAELSAEQARKAAEQAHEAAQEELRTLRDFVGQLKAEIERNGGTVPKPHGRRPAVTPPPLPKTPHVARRTPAKTPGPKAGSSALKTSAAPAPAPVSTTGQKEAAAGTAEADSSARQEPTLTPSSAQFLDGIAEPTPQPAEAAAGGVAAAGAAAAEAEPGEGGGGPERTTSLSPFLQVPGIGKKKKGKKRAD